MAVLAHTGPAARYPAERETDVVLRDGATIHVRPVSSGDTDLIARFLESLSLRAQAFRFFGAGVDTRQMASLCATVDYRDSYGVVAIAGDEVVAHAMYARIDDASGAVAVAIVEPRSGPGLG